MPTSVISPSKPTLNVDITLPDNLQPGYVSNNKITCNYSFAKIYDALHAGTYLNCRILYKSAYYPAKASMQEGMPVFVFDYFLPYGIGMTGMSASERKTCILEMTPEQWMYLDISLCVVSLQKDGSTLFLPYTFDNLLAHVSLTHDIVAIQDEDTTYYLYYCDNSVIAFVNTFEFGENEAKRYMSFTSENVTEDNSYVIAEVKLFAKTQDSTYFAIDIENDDGSLTNVYRLTLSERAKSRLEGTFNNNLLDNWYFVNPVNQRGANTYTGTVFGIDRWRGANANTKITITSYDTSTALPTKDTGLTLQSTDTSVLPFLSQTVKCPELLLGKTLTLSVLTREDTLFSATAAIPSSISNDNTLLIDIANVVDLLGMKNGNMYVRLKTANGSTALAFKAVKLEIGDQQTLCHKDANGNYVLNAIADYSMELLKCQRYLQIIRSPYQTTVGNGVAVGWANNAGDLWVSFPLTVPMRIAPTINIESDGKDYLKIAKSTTDTMKEVTKITGGWATNVSHACNMRSIIFTTSGLTKGETYTLFMLQGAKLILTSEI